VGCFSNNDLQAVKCEENQMKDKTIEKYLALDEYKYAITEKNSQQKN